MSSLLFATNLRGNNPTVTQQRADAAPSAEQPAPPPAAEESEAEADLFDLTAAEDDVWGGGAHAVAFALPAQLRPAPTAWVPRAGQQAPLDALALPVEEWQALLGFGVSPELSAAKQNEPCRGRGPQGSYEGSCKVRLGQLQGRGTFRIGQDSFQLQWATDGRENVGQEQILFHSGDMYGGEIRAFVAEGEGDLRLRTHGVRRGHFRAGQLDGFATELFADGRRYEGQWRAGGFHGKGRCLAPR